MHSEFTRRRALATMASLGVLTVGATTRSAWATPPAVSERIAALEDRHGARIGVSATDLRTGNSVAHRADQRFALCSTFKTYAATRVLQLADTGALDLDAPVPVLPEEIVVYSPITEQSAGSALSLRELCAAALMHSDNTAGNLLLRAIGGPAEVTALARSVGDTTTRLDRWEPELNTALPGDPRDTTTPAGLATGYRTVLTGGALTGEALPGPARDQLLDWMRANVTSGTRFRAGLPPGWTSADKTGGGDYGSTNNAGLLIGPGGEQVVAVVLARSRTDRQDSDPFNAAIADTVRLLLAEFGYGR